MVIRHIYWFAYYNINCPSVRYRGKYFLEFIKEQQKISSDFVFPGYSLGVIAHFISIYFNVLFFRKKNSVIVFQKLYTKGIYAFALKLLMLFRNRNTIYDIDDAEYIRFQPETIQFFMKRCTCTITGSEQLSIYAKQFSHNVKIISSPVIDHSWIKNGKNEIFTIGWIGFYNTRREHSKEFSGKKVLEKYIYHALLELKFPIRVLLITSMNDDDWIDLKEMFAPYPNIQIEIPSNVDWLNESSVYKMISGCDVGVAPLLDCEMHRAKSAFKLKQFLSCGVPVLANDIGENKNFLKDGKNGFVCQSPTAFSQRMVQINEMDQKCYAELSHNAKDSLCLFSMQKYADDSINDNNFST